MPSIHTRMINIISDKIGTEVLAKIVYFNPFGSVKERLYEKPLNSRNPIKQMDVCLKVRVHLFEIIGYYQIKFQKSLTKFT